jgi:hypothetical protein
LRAAIGGFRMRRQIRFFASRSVEEIFGGIPTIPIPRAQAAAVIGRVCAPLECEEGSITMMMFRTVSASTACKWRWLATVAIFLAFLRHPPSLICQTVQRWEGAGATRPYPSIEAACDAALQALQNGVKRPVKLASIERVHESGLDGATCHLEYWQTVPGFAQPVIQRIPAIFVEVCSGPAKPSGFCSPERPSHLVTIRITGTVAFGNDAPGIFGKPAADLSGKPFTLTYSFDDTKGLMQVVSCVGPSCASRIAAIHQKSSPGTAVLRIGDGPPHSFGIATDGSADSSAQKGTLPCCNYGRTYSLGLDVRDSESSVALTVTNTAEGTPATKDGDWRAPFFDAHVARRVPNRDNAADLGFGVQKNGRLLSSGGLIPETLCVGTKQQPCSQ